jgi:hypothetical protein
MHPKAAHRSEANVSFVRRMTVPAVWLGCRGIERYAAVTSRTDICEPGGRVLMIQATALGRPQVHGKSEMSIRELIEGMSANGLCGYKKFWISLFLSGLWGFGRIEQGETWKPLG